MRPSPSRGWRPARRPGRVGLDAGRVRALATAATLAKHRLWGYTPAVEDPTPLTRRTPMIVTTAWLALLAVMLVAGLVPAPAAAQPAGTLVVGLVAEPDRKSTRLNSSHLGT